MLSKETLHPLTAKSVQFSYNYDRPLHSIATCYAPASSSPISEKKNSYTLLLAGGISLNQETWLPVIKEIYELTSQPTSPVHVRSVWVVEQPNHGDAGVLNQKELKEHYSKTFKSLQFATAIRTFLDSDILSAPEKETLIGIGHSVGSTAMAQSLEIVKSPSSLQALVIIEPPLVGQEAAETFKGLYIALERSNSRRPRRWASKDAAMLWLKGHYPWKIFHPDVFQVMSESYFLPDPENDGGVIPKTAVEQETASFLNDGSQLSTLGFLRSIYHQLPSHLIMGSRREIWPPAMELEVQNNVEQDRPSLASVRTIEAGHYIPVETPKKLAQEIVQILVKSARAGLTKL